VGRQGVGGRAVGRVNRGPYRARLSASSRQLLVLMKNEKRTTNAEDCPAGPPGSLGPAGQSRLQGEVGFLRVHQPQILDGDFHGRSVRSGVEDDFI
jgi:hypothetical protein